MKIVPLFTQPHTQVFHTQSYCLDSEDLEYSTQAIPFGTIISDQPSAC